MALLHFGKNTKTVVKKADQEASTSCTCGGCRTQESKENRFIVLGACCEKSRRTFENTKQAVRELGYGDEVLNVGDALEIARYGVMQTPALVVDGQVTSTGKLLSVDQVKDILGKLNLS